MTVSKVTVSLDPAIAERARRDVADGKARSVSAWLNDAARERIENDDLASVLTELFAAAGGPLTPHELTRARQRLARAGGREAWLARLINARDVLVESLTDAGARAAGMLCGATGTAGVIDASVVLAARRRHATVLSSDRGDLRRLDPTIPVVEC